MADQSNFRIMLRKGLPILAGIGALVLVIAWLAGAFEAKIPPGKKAVAERRLGDRPVTVVSRVTLPTVAEAVGTLRAAHRTEISSRVLATIEEITVRAGDRVDAGQVLVRLDEEELQARLEEAEEALKSAQASLQAARRDWERAQELFAGKAVPRSRYDDAKAAFGVAEAEVARAEHRLRQMRVVHSYALLKAPRAGRVVDRIAQPGDTARPGEPLLVLYDAGSLRLEAPVVGALALRLQVGDELTVHIDALDRTLSGQVAEIVPQADVASRSFLVKISVAREPDLYEGMFGRVQIPAGHRERLCIPEAAVLRIGQLELVDVAREDGTLERRYIRTGRRCPPHGIEVLSGLDAGERVVADRSDATTDSQATHTGGLPVPRSLDPSNPPPRNRNGSWGHSPSAAGRGMHLAFPRCPRSLGPSDPRTLDPSNPPRA